MKRLVLCLDGTWNDNRADVRPTNVAKLHKVIAAHDANGLAQVSHYVSGIASAGGEKLAFLKGAVGYGVAANIQKAYALIVQSYEAGDDIHIFGFSRGAFEARSLASLIHLVGVAKNGGFTAADAWAVYVQSEKVRDTQKLSSLQASAHYPVRIRCLGVWDTVGNIGNPFFAGTPLSRSVSFHDLTLHDTVDVALHALSIDEKRGTFRPSLWTLPEGESPPPHQRVEQVWFAGTHADVGGGWRETGLADVALIWMAKRASETTGLAIDWEALNASARPDPLGPQHDSLTGKIFGLARLVPFVRPIGQSIEAISPMRRRWLGTWRTGLLPRNDVPVNEALHESVGLRFGRKVIELRDGRSHMMTYRPDNLVPAIGEAAALAPARSKDAPRRVKVFTVHGTFAHETDWDNWDASASNGDAGSKRQFINTLSERLKENGVTLDEADHSQFNWSGGNSHDERRTAAIGLKKHIDSVLAEDKAKHGEHYYDGVYVIGHSHGGTISRLAMNLWDKDFNYYDPDTSNGHDEFKHDDTCETCKRSRNGKVRPSSAPRPDGIITFGSPFVTFRKRKAGVFNAKLAAWSFRALVAIPLLAMFVFAYIFGPYSVPSGIWQVLPGVVKSALLIAGPLILYWLIGKTAGALVATLERLMGKSPGLLALNAALQGLKFAVLLAVAAYYYLYATGQLNVIAEWPPLTSDTAKTWIGWTAVSAAALLLLVALPGAFLSWIRRDVSLLVDKLPKKYDPAEDYPVPYVNYHAPGDEAGLGLRLITALTWTTQTLAVAAVTVLVFGFILMVLSMIEAGLGYAEAGSLLSRVNLSPASHFPEERDSFIALIDRLTWLPRTVWSDLFGSSWWPALGDLENRREITWYIPLAIGLSTLTIFLFLMPLVALAVAIVYLASMWLRRSGVAFGSEKLSWTIANAIDVHRLANENSSFRLVPIAPAAWWRKEIAHCYYYRSPKVIDDVAATIAGWQGHEPARGFALGRMIGSAGRIFVVALFALSIFAVSVPVAQVLVSQMSAIGAFFGAPDWGMSGPGAMADPKTAAEFAQRGQMYSAINEHDRAFADLNRSIEMEPGTAEFYRHRAKAYRKIENLDSAFADYSKAIELAPQVAGYRYSRAAILSTQGAFDAALADLNAGIDIDPSNASAYSSRGTTHMAKGDTALALADYGKAADLAPERAAVQLVYAAARYGAGDFAGAATVLSRKFDERDPMFPYIAAFQALSKRRLGDRDAGVAISAEAAADTTKWPNPILTFLNGKATETELLGMAKTSGQTCEATYYIGQIHFLQGRSAEGQKALETVISQCPVDFVERIAATAELKRTDAR